VKRSTRMVILISLGSAAACFAAVVHFLLTLSRNGLPSLEENFVREHYLTVGRFYTQGFIVGFFLCFSLTVAAVTVNRWWEARSARFPGPGPSATTAPRRDGARTRA
jgi:hypothetical protein